MRRCSTRPSRRANSTTSTWCRPDRMQARRFSMYSRERFGRRFSSPADVAHAVPGWNRSGGGALRMGRDDALRRCGVLQQLRGGPYRALDEVPAAVRTDAVEALLDALGAERALVGADAGGGIAVREVAIAAFAVGAEVELHATSLPAGRRPGGTAGHTSTRPAGRSSPSADAVAADSP